MSIKVKICGIRRPEAIEAAVENGVDFLGMVFYPPSPRYIEPITAAQLSAMIPTDIKVVSLFVDPTNDFLDSIAERVPMDMIQLHGHETPERVAEIKDLYKTRVIKAIQISEKSDLKKIAQYSEVCDWLLFDAKPPKNVACLPGGNALSFDWAILSDQEWKKTWLLAGGLNVNNLAKAVRISGATSVDISSGVEEQPGYKSPEKIKAFLKLAKTLQSKSRIAGT